MLDLLLQVDWSRNLFWILIFVLGAIIVIRLSDRLGKRIARMYKKRGHLPLTPERQMTLGGIFAGIIRLCAVSMAILASLGLFVSIDTLVWMVGLFSAAFGLGARPFISDILTGMTFITENTFSVGDKVEMMDTSGLVERVNLRTTWLRAPSGELFVLPNGDIRKIRNFSRGKYSQLKVTLHIRSHLLDVALPLLEELGREAVSLLPNLIEPWQVLSEGDLAEKTTLVILAKARFGKAADMKPRLESLVQQRLNEAEISLG